MSKTESKKEEGKDRGIVNQPGVREMALFLEVLSTLIRQFVTADASSSHFYPNPPLSSAHTHTLKTTLEGM